MDPITISSSGPIRLFVRDDHVILSDGEFEIPLNATHLHRLHRALPRVIAFLNFDDRPEEKGATEPDATIAPEPAK